jgi:hypothetical protein
MPKSASLLDQLHVTASPGDPQHQHDIHPQQAIAERAAGHGSRAEVAVELCVRALDAESIRGRRDRDQRHDDAGKGEPQDRAQLAQLRVASGDDEAEWARRRIENQEPQLESRRNVLSVDEVRVRPIRFEREKVGAHRREHQSREEEHHGERARGDPRRGRSARQVFARAPRECHAEGKADERSEGSGHGRAKGCAQHYCLKRLLARSIIGAPMRPLQQTGRRIFVSANLG